MKHTQHTKLPRPHKGYYGQNEMSALGSNCGNIKTLFKAIAEGLSPTFRIGYVDADHVAGKGGEHGAESPFEKVIIDKISHHQFDAPKEVSTYTKHAFFNSSDLVLVNGNHAKANQQIVFIDPKKEASLIKRKASLTNVKALIHLEEADRSIPDYIKTLIPDWEALPLFSFHDKKAIRAFVKALMEEGIPKVNGLVLAGGKSSRMGEDKTQINYHGKPQYQHLQSLLTPFCEAVFMSCRAQQEAPFENAIPDAFFNLGAFGGILSAFQQFPNSAWFAVACDIPLIDASTLETLFSRRNPSKLATAFYNSDTDFPEPLITIWEPRAYPVLLHYLSLGYSCPRKVLINSDIELVHLKDEQVLLNANTAKERDAIMSKLAAEKA